MSDPGWLLAMREHVETLVDEHQIVLNWTRRRAFASIDIEEINVPPIRSAVSYATALHEIGHILGRHQRSRRVMVRESWAWRWARQNALVWTPAMERSAQTALEWYGPRAAKIDREQARWPTFQEQLAALTPPRRRRRAPGSVFVFGRAAAGSGRSARVAPPLRARAAARARRRRSADAAQHVGMCRPGLPSAGAQRKRWANPKITH